MNTISTEQIITRYFVKYNQLRNLIFGAFSGSRATEVNMFIDLYGLYKTMFSRTYRTDVSDYTAFTSTIINMCAHYRGFFKGMGVYTKFFIISSYNIPEINTRFVAGYNKSMKEKLMNQQVKEMVEINKELLSILCPYLPDIHFLQTEFESTVLIHEIIEKEIKEGNNNPNIILSTDLYPIQLCNCFPNTIFLRPRKAKGEDFSMCTVPNDAPEFDINFWSMVALERDGLRDNVKLTRVSPANFVLLMSMTRFPERNFKSLINTTVAEKTILEIARDSKIGYNVEALYSANPDLYNRFPKETLNARYKCLAVQYQVSLFRESLEATTLHYENLQDPNAVNMINDKYFSNNPIDVFRL